MRACKLKRVGCCSYSYEPALGSHFKLHSSASDNDEKAVSVTHHELLLLRGLSQAARRLQEKSAESWSSMPVVHRAGQGRERASSQRLLLPRCLVWSIPRGKTFGYFLFPFVLRPLQGRVTFSKTANPMEWPVPILLPRLRELTFTWTHAKPGKELGHLSPPDKEFLAAPFSVGLLRSC